MYGQRQLCLVQFRHWGKFSSQRMCRRLHVSQPLRDLVWLRRGGPPPGPAIDEDEEEKRKTTRLERVKAVDDYSNLKLDQQW